MLDKLKDFDARYFFQKYNPSNIFKKKQPVDDPDDYTPLLDGGNPIEGVIETEESWASIIFGWFKGLLTLVVLGGIFIGILYSLLATFLILWVPIGSNSDIMDRQFVVRNTWSDTAGVPPVGDNAVISLSTGKSVTKFYDYTIWGFTGIPYSAEVKVLSADRDSVTVKPNPIDKEAEFQTGTAVLTSFDGSRENAKFSDFTGSLAFDFDPEDPETPDSQVVELAGEKLLVECISGDCVPGTVFIVNSDQVFGKIFSDNVTTVLKEENKDNA